MPAGMSPEGEVAIVVMAVALSLAAIVVASASASLARGLTRYAGLVAGLVLLAVSLLHLLPETLADGRRDIAFYVVGIFLGLGLDRLFQGFSKSDGAVGVERLARVSLIALAVHSTLDGAAYAAAFGHSEATGFVASAGLIIHEAPEGVVALAMASQLRLGAISTLLLAALASSATTPVGWLAARFLGSTIHSGMELLFPVSAGLLLYIAIRLVWGGFWALRRQTTDGQ